jgi:hypothetical protein
MTEYHQLEPPIELNWDDVCAVIGPVACQALQASPEFMSAESHRAQIYFACQVLEQEKGAIPFAKVGLIFGLNKSIIRVQQMKYREYQGQMG